VLARGSGEALELRLRERGRALRALGVDPEALAVPARVTVDHREVQRVRVEAADRGQAPLERLRCEGRAVGLGWARYSAR
jgi:hypothetical protein